MGGDPSYVTGPFAHEEDRPEGLGVTLTPPLCDLASLGLSFPTGPMGMPVTPPLPAGHRPVALGGRRRGGPALPGHSRGDAGWNPSWPRWDLRRG